MADHGGVVEWRGLAQAFLGQGYYEEAEQCFQVAVRQAPDDQESVYGLGFCLERMGRLDEAVTVLQRAAQLSDDELARTCWYQIGRCHLRGERVEDAERAFRSVADHPAAAYQLAKLLIRTGRAEEAVPLLERQMADNPDSHRLMQLRALAAESLGDDETAHVFRDRQQRAPSGLTIDYGMTFISLYRSRHGLDRRLTTCTRLATAASLSQCGDCLEGVLEIVRAEDLKQYDSVYQKAAEVMMAQQQPARALGLLDELRGLESEDHAALELRGDAQWLIGDSAAAGRAWERSLLQLPTPRVHAKLADWFHQAGDAATAAEHRAAAHQLAGIRAYYENRIPDAERELHQATEQAPQSARSWYYFGETQRLLDRPAEALDAYSRCLELDPDYEPARRNTALLTDRQR